MADKDRTVGPEAYPKPTETDQQWKQQDEYSTMRPNRGPEQQDVNAQPTTDQNTLRSHPDDQVIEGTP